MQYLKKVIGLYIKWSIIYAPLAIMNYYFNGYSILKAIADYVRGFLFVGEHYNSWHLWYLLGLIIAIIYMWVTIYKLKLSYKTMVVISFLIYLVSYVITMLCQSGTDNIVIVLWSKVFGNARVFTGILPVALGFVLAENNLLRTKSIYAHILIFVGAFVLSVANISLMITRVCVVLSSYMLFVICLKVDFRLKFNY